MLATRFIKFVRDYYQSEDFIPLHAPLFSTTEREAVLDAIDSTFVSSVGEYVTKVEDQLREITGAKYAVATSSGTAALHVALRIAGAKQDTEVITQPLSFVATANAIAYLGAQPVFLDINEQTLSLCPQKLDAFLRANTVRKDGNCLNLKTNRPIVACVPMHTFGLPGLITDLRQVCDDYGIALVEDAAEALGSNTANGAIGTFGQSGVLSFNGNKIVTAGGGGAILTNSRNVAEQAKHLTTTAKLPHPWHYEHDAIGYNYRMPNLNAALLFGQLKRLGEFVAEKRDLAKRYHAFFGEQGVMAIRERLGTQSNYWLNAIVLDSKQARDDFLEKTNSSQVMTRPAWKLLCDLPMFQQCEQSDLSQSRKAAACLVNLPSSPNLIK